jgi:hypothetical protein
MMDDPILSQVFKSNTQNDETPKKKKRVLSEKQLAALARGREKRQQKLKEKMEKSADKEMVKQDKDNRKQKKVLIKEQTQVQHQLRLNEENTEINDFKNKINNVKNSVLNNIEDPKVWKTMKKYFDNIKIQNKQDIAKLKSKLESDLNSIKKTSSNNKEQ